MAQTIESLFGLTPDAVQAQQAAQLNQQAMAYAQLNPLQAARAGLFRAGSQLGSGIAGALGYQDPELLRAQQRQGMLSALDINDPNALMQAAQTAQRSGDFPLAQTLQAQAQDLAKQVQSQMTTQASAAAEQRALAGRTAFVKRRYPELSDEEAAALATDKTAVAKLLETPKTETQVIDADGRTRLIDKATGRVIADLGKAPEKGTRVSVGISPVIKQATGITGLVQDFENLTKVPRETLGLAQSAQSLINEARKANNSQAWEAARTTLAKAIGEGKLSNEDIRRTGVDPRLIQGALDWVNRKVEGVPNESIMQQLYATAKLLERVSTQRIESSTGRVKKIAEMEGIPQEQLPVLFPSVQTPAAGSAGVVDWNNLK